MANNLYRAHGENRPGGDASIKALAAQISFDGSKGMGENVPGPAHLLAASLAACVLKNVERFSHILPFDYRSATVAVVLERQDKPPKIIRASYELEVETDESVHRAALLHKNIRLFGTITNTLASACEVVGTLRVKRSSGQVESLGGIESSTDAT